jgi:hypothetical protein
MQIQSGFWCQLVIVVMEIQVEREHDTIITSNGDGITSQTKTQLIFL